MSHETQRDLVLHRLEQGPAGPPDFWALGIARYGARIWELRKRGVEITSTEKYVGKSRHVTYWLGKPPATNGELFPARTHRNATHDRTCAECGERFSTKKAHAKFCSDAHRAMYWKRKRAERERTA